MRPRPRATQVATLATRRSPFRLHAERLDELHFFSRVGGGAKPDEEPFKDTTGPIPDPFRDTQLMTTS